MSLADAALAPANLPGPGRFLSLLADGLREGRSVVLALPEAAPEWIVPALREHLRDDAPRWMALTVDGREPLAQLFAEFLPNYPGGEVHDLAQLYESPAFQGRTLALVGMDAACWERWRPFLEKFAAHSRQMPILRRAQFFVPCRHRISVPREDLLLAHHCWREVCDPLDARIYAALLAGRLRSGSPLRRDLSAQISAELALWDFELCAALAHNPINALLEPTTLLREYGQERGFSKSSQDGLTQAEQWFAGISQPFDGRWEKHSAYLAVQGDQRAISHRLWKGQMVVLFPFVELQRQELLRRFGYRLRPPFRGSDGVPVQDIRDLGIGQLSHLLTMMAGSSLSAVARYARALKEIRNALAHLEPVPSVALRLEELEVPPW